MEKRPIAAFDIDGTVYRSSLVLNLVERLVERGLFPPTAAAEYDDERLEWLDRKGDYPSYIDKVVQTFGKRIKGLAFGEVANLAGEIIEERKDRVYRYTRDLIKDLKGQGYYLLAISHSPKFMVDGFCYEQGFDKAYGTFYTTGALDCFTGEIEDADLINNKAAILHRVLRKEGLALEGSIAVGDTESDIPMLELVERSIAFNPNSQLYKHAKRRHWEVVVERKDVIYEL